MSILFVNKEKTLMMRVDKKNKARVEDRADFYDLSYAQMIAFLEELQTLLELPVTTTIIEDKETQSVTLSEFWQTPVQPWIREPLGFDTHVTLKEVATYICAHFDGDFEKIPSFPTSRLVWCSYLLRNWDDSKCDIIHFERNVQGEILGGNGNHRRLVLAVGYLSGRLPKIPFDAIVPYTRIDTIDIPELLSYTDGIPKERVAQWREAGGLTDRCSPVRLHLTDLLRTAKKEAQ